MEDKDEIQHKDPSFTVQDQFDGVFGIKLNNEKDGILSLKVVSISSFTTKQASRQPAFLRLSNAFNDIN